MKSIPLKKCANCGIYSDFTVSTCKCGEDITNTTAFLVDINEISNNIDLYGEINEDLPVYVQKCPRCGSLCFTADSSKRVMLCHNCYKKRVGDVTPIELKQFETENVDTDFEDPEETSDDERNQQKTNDPSSDRDISECQKMLFTIQQSMIEANGEIFDNTLCKSYAVENTSEGQTNEDEDEDIADMGEWSMHVSRGNTLSEYAESMSKKKDITLVAITCGSLSFTIPAKQNTPYMLGRSANQSEFLMQDKRVSNKHCHLVFSDGLWFVIDNHSTNGTMVNYRCIGVNGKSQLCDGDVLKLGCSANSMAFRVSIV